MPIPLEKHPAKSSTLNFDGIRVKQFEEIDRYLAGQPGLDLQINEILREARQRFPRISHELSLELYRDHEINEKYLTLYVRAIEYTDQTMDEIDSLSEQINGRFPRLDVRFLITTDFQPAGTKDGL